MKKEAKYDWLHYLVILFIIIIQVYVIVYLSVNFKDYEYFKMLSRFYQTINDSKNQILYYNAYSFFKKLFEFRILTVMFLSMTILNLSQIHKNKEKLKNFPQVLQDYELGLKLNTLMILLIFISWFIYININVNVNITFEYITYFVIIIITSVLFEILFKKLTNNVNKRLKQINNNDYLEQNIYDCSLKRYSSKFNKFYLFTKYILFTIFLCLMLLSLYNFQKYYKVKPKQLVINNDFSLYEDGKRKICTNNVKNISCYPNYKYEDFFSDYKVSHLQLVIDDQNIVDNLSNGKYHFYILYNNSSFEIKQSDVSINNNTFDINLENTYEQTTNHKIDFEYLQISIQLVFEQDNKEYTAPININSITEYKIILFKIG